MQALARYWAEGYDWSKCEEKLKALPHFIAEIDGLDIHFIHVRSDHEDALPLIVARMARLDHRAAEDHRSTDQSDGKWRERIGRFPSGDSVDAGLRILRQAGQTGWGPEHIASAWAELMKRLGYDRYVATGGDWGGQIVDLMGAQAPPGLIGIHTNFPGAVRPDVAAAVQSGGPAPPGLNDKETRLYDKLADFFATDVGYAIELGYPPQALYGIADSPSAWPPGCSTTTRLAWRSSLASLSMGLRKA